MQRIDAHQFAGGWIDGHLRTAIDRAHSQRWAPVPDSNTRVVLQWSRALARCEERPAVLICIVVQFCAMTWYALSYMPFGRRLLKSCLRTAVDV